jgi:hypothetical protein
MAASITYDEMEARNFAILAKTAKTLIALGAKPSRFMKLTVLWNLLVLEYFLRHMLAIFHRPEAVRKRLFEVATSEQRQKLAAYLDTAYGRVDHIIKRVSSNQGRHTWVLRGH